MKDEELPVKDEMFPTKAEDARFRKLPKLEDTKN